VFIINTWIAPACVLVFAGPPPLPVDIARLRPEVGRRVLPQLRLVLCIIFVVVVVVVVVLTTVAVDDDWRFSPAVAAADAAHRANLRAVRSVCSLSNVLRR